MKNKRWLLLLVIVFPSLFWLILETSTINSRKLPHYGPKTALSDKDTMYYQVPRQFYTHNASGALQADSIPYPLYSIVFIQPKYRADAFRLAGLWEYANYKQDKIEHIPFVLVFPVDSAGHSQEAEELKKLSETKNIHFYYWPKSSFDSLVKVYFKEKPYYIDYSFFQLIDANNNIRGYYDARYVSETKRFIDEYKHLRLKEEKQLLIEENEITKNH